MPQTHHCNTPPPDLLSSLQWHRSLRLWLFDGQPVELQWLQLQCQGGTVLHAAHGLPAAKRNACEARLRGMSYSLAVSDDK